MFRHRVLSIGCGTQVLFALVVVASMQTTPAAAIVSKQFTYSDPKTGYYSVHPMAMAPDGDESASSFHISFEGGSLAGQGCYSAGVNLPQGAEMTSLTVYYQSDDRGDMGVQLQRHALQTGNDVQIVDESHEDDSNARTSVTFPIGVAKKVNNKSFGYGLGVCLESGTLFFGATIEYSYGNAGD